MSAIIEGILFDREERSTASDFDSTSAIHLNIHNGEFRNINRSLNNHPSFLAPLRVPLRSFGLSQKPPYPSLIPTISIVPPFPSCDHSGLSFSLSSPQSPSLPSQIRDFARVDYSAFSNYLLSIDWFSLFCDCPDIDSIYSAFSSAIHSAIDLFVPYRTPRPPSLSYPPHIRRLIKHRDALFSKVHLPSVRILFDQCSKKLLFEIDKWTRYSTRKKLSRVNDLYRHISSLTKPKLSIPELVSPQNLPVFDSISKSNLLSSEFASHFTLDDGCLPSLSLSRVPPSLSLFTFFPHEVYKYLRAQVRSDLKNSSSIKIRAQKATSKMFLLLKALPFNCPSILIRIYKAYVLPLLDFASPFWNPHYLSDIATLEKVKHTFTRQLFYRCFPSPDYPLSLPSYSDRIKTLGLRALTERRVIGDLCMTHMIMNGFTIIPRSLFYVYKPLRDRTSSFGINIELTTSTPRYHSFPVRTSRWYSQLPDSIRTTPNIRMFKRRLENHPIIAHLAKLT
ncbi:hypothetical protein PRIPAC_96045 [Pristionchus pacificus]|uniref:Uncharacterized protein n=1 Tax=Pristionchus pacificus TaxID=54126 RepID=A0A2A6B389_PRIPA|nr:hypothetical protein PRIPAC_96045 [Pristionchus pacificus]|eukprot:PDM60328.1 hypothetical protein PRIPAC_54153 [Pristionchus pacificus]